jgi:hypothetical protein
MEIDELPTGALQAAATLAAAMLQFRVSREMPEDKFMMSLYSSALTAVLAGAEDALLHAAHTPRP